ncbi:MAG: WD40 repeat domain-containing protein [Bacteroidota bacterium]
MLTRINSREGHRAAIYALRPAEDGFYSAAADGFLVHWHRDDVDFGRVVAKVDGGKFLCLETLPDDGLVAGALDGGVHWLYPGAEERNRHVAHHRRGVFATLRIGEELFTAGGDGVLTRWSVTTRRTVESLPLSANSLRCIAYAPERDLLAVGASDGRIYLLERESLRQLGSQPANAPSVFTVAFSPDGRYVISGGRDAQLRFFTADLASVAMEPLPAHLATVNHLAYDPRGRFMATASRDKTVKLWDAETYKLLKVGEVVRDKGHVNSVNTLLWLDETTLLTAGDDRRILEWRVG